MSTMPLPFSWGLTHGAEFANDMCLLTIHGDEVEFLMEQARPDGTGQPVLHEVIAPPFDETGSGSGTWTVGISAFDFAQRRRPS